MRFKKREPLFNVLLGTGIYLLYKLRERLPDNMDSIKSRLRDTYDIASGRVSRATNVLRGKEDSQTFGKIGALLTGLGIGAGVGLLVAPASGDKTRANLADKVSDFSDNVRERTGKKPQGATETYGESEHAV